MLFVDNIFSFILNDELVIARSAKRQISALNIIGSYCLWIFLVRNRDIESRHQKVELEFPNSFRRFLIIEYTFHKLSFRSVSSMISLTPSQIN